MKRWIGKLAKTLVKGLSSILVCLVVALPLLLVIFQVTKAFAGDNRKATPLPAFVNRKIDSTLPPKLFIEPLITVTFDDGWETTYTSAAPLLQKYGIHSTQYLLSGTESYPGYLSWDQIVAMQKAGQEIACHTVTHPDLTSITDNNLAHELTGCKATLSQRFGPVTDFASPYGAANAHTLAAIRQVYRSQRNINGTLVDGASNFDVNLGTNFDRYNIIGVSVHRDTTVEQLRQAVNYTVAHDGWLVLVYHQAEDGNSQLTIDPDSLNKQLAYISSTPVRIVTTGQVLNSVEGSTRSSK